MAAGLFGPSGAAAQTPSSACPSVSSGQEWVCNFDVISTGGSGVGTFSAAGGGVNWRGNTFTTGTAANGYTLDSVTFSVRGITGSPGALRVAIHEEASGGGPEATAHGTLSGSVSATGMQTYTASGITLAANTTYFVLFTAPDAAAGDNVYIIFRTTGTTTAGTETGSAGWSIGDKHWLSFGTTTYTEQSGAGSDPLAMAVLATPAAPTECPTTMGEQEQACNLGVATSGSVFAPVGLDSGQTQLERWATSFTTGSAENGYDLDSVSLAFTSVFGSPGSLVVAVFENNSSGRPANVAHGTLSGSNPTTAGTPVFTANNIKLDASTTYWLVLSAPTTSTSGSSNAYNFALADATTEFADAGWSLGDTAFRARGSGAFSSQGNTPLKFAVVAAPAAPPPSLSEACPTTTGAQVQVCNLGVAAGADAVRAGYDPANSGRGRQAHATAFTTGSAAHGYSLASVSLALISVFGTGGSLGNLVVAIHEEASGGGPAASAHGTLTGTNPTNADANSTISYTATDIRLDASTTYYMVVSAPTASTSGSDAAYIFTRASATTEFTNDGWTMADTSYRSDNGGAFAQTTDAALRFAVVAAPADAPPPTVSIAASQEVAFEATGAMLNFALSYSAAFTADQEVVVVLTGADNYVAAANRTQTVTIPAAQAITLTVPVSFPIVNDSTDNGGAMALATIQAAPGAYTISGLAGAASIAIRDNDGPPGVTAAPTALSISEPAGEGTYTLALNSVPSGDVTVTPTLATTGVASFSPTAFTFTGSDWFTPQTVTVTATNDSVENTGGERTATIQHTVTSPAAGYDSLDTSAVDTVALTVTDDDAPPPTITCPVGTSLQQQVCNYAENGRGNPFTIGTASTEGVRLGAATAFTTGAHAQGYSVNSVGVSFFAREGSPGQLRVAIHTAASGGGPGRRIGVASGSTPTTEGAHNFAASDVNLSANTTYYLVLDAPSSTGSTNRYRAARANSGDQVSGDGWTIADGCYTQVGDADWDDTDCGNPLVFSILALPRTTVVTRPTLSIAAPTTGPVRERDSITRALLSFPIRLNREFSGVSPNIVVTLSSDPASALDPYVAAENRSVTVSFATSTTSVHAMFRIMNNDMDDGGATVTATVTPNTGAFDLGTGSATAAIWDDDGPVLTIAATNAPLTEAAGASLTFSISAGGESFSSAQTLTVTLTDADDYVAAASRVQSVTIPASSSAAVSVSFPITDDAADNRGATAIATISEGALFTVAGPATATIVDDETGVCPAPSANQERVCLLNKAAGFVEPVVGRIEDDEGMLGPQNVSGNSFIVGQHAGGYNLNSVRLSVATLATQMPESMVVAIYTDSSDRPGTQLGTLSLRGSALVVGDNDFDASGTGIELDTSTHGRTFWLVLTKETGSAVTLRATGATTAADASFVTPGWSVPGQRLAGTSVAGAAVATTPRLLFSVLATRVGDLVTSAPTAVTTTPGPGSLRVEWTASEVPRVPTGYEVCAYQTTTGFPFAGAFCTGERVREVSTAGDGSLSITGLGSSAPLWTAVRGTHDDGDSDWTAAAASVTPLAPAPHAPTSVRAMAGNADIEVSWGDADTDTGNSAPTQFTACAVTASADFPADASTCAASATTAASARTASLTGLANGTAYKVAVRGVVQGGVSAWVASVPPTVTPTLPQLRIAAVGTATEGTDATLDFRVTTSAAFDAQVTAVVTLTGADAFVAQAARTQTVTFAAGVATAQTARFPITDDNTDNTGVIATATLTPNAAVFVLSVGTATARIVDDEAPVTTPELTLAAVNSPATEGDGEEGSGVLSFSVTPSVGFAFPQRITVVVSSTPPDALDPYIVGVVTGPDGEQDDAGDGNREQALTMSAGSTDALLFNFFIEDDLVDRGGVTVTARILPDTAFTLAAGGRASAEIRDDDGTSAPHFPTEEDLAGTPPVLPGADFVNGPPQACALVSGTGFDDYVLIGRDFGTQHAYAMSFRTGDTPGYFRLQTASFHVGSRSGSPGMLRAAIHADARGVPGGEEAGVLRDLSVSPDGRYDLSTDAAGVPLSRNTDYWLVLSAPDAPNSGRNIYFVRSYQTTTRATEGWDTGQVGMRRRGSGAWEADGEADRPATAPFCVVATPVIPTVALTPVQNTVAEVAGATLDFAVTVSPPFHESRELTVTLTGADHYIALAQRTQTITFAATASDDDGVLEAPTSGRPDLVLSAATPPRFVSFRLYYDSADHGGATAVARVAQGAGFRRAGPASAEIVDARDAFAPECDSASGTQEQVCNYEIVAPPEVTCTANDEEQVCNYEVVDPGSAVALPVGSYTDGEGTSQTRQAATTFRTGAHTGGYTLDSVGAVFMTTRGEPGGITVAIHEEASGVPGARVGTLSGPNPRRPGTYRFGAGGGFTLAASTRYFVVFSAPGAGGADNHYRVVTAVGHNEPVKSPGWRIGNTYFYQRDGGGFVSTGGGARPLGLSIVASPRVPELAIATVKTPVLEGTDTTLDFTITPDLAFASEQVITVHLSESDTQPNLGQYVMGTRTVTVMTTTVSTVRVSVRIPCDSEDVRLRPAERIHCESPFPFPTDSTPFITREVEEEVTRTHELEREVPQTEQYVTIPAGSTEPVTVSFPIANNNVNHGGTSVTAFIAPQPTAFTVAGAARAHIEDDDFAASNSNSDAGLHSLVVYHGSASTAGNELALAPAFSPEVVAQYATSDPASSIDARIRAHASYTLAAPPAGTTHIRVALQTRSGNTSTLRWRVFNVDEDAVGPNSAGITNGAASFNIPVPVGIQSRFRVSWRSGDGASAFDLTVPGAEPPELTLVPLNSPAVEGTDDHLSFNLMTSGAFGAAQTVTVQLLRTCAIPGHPDFRESCTSHIRLAQDDEEVVTIPADSTAPVQVDFEISTDESVLPVSRYVVVVVDDAPSFTLGGSAHAEVEDAGMHGQLTCPPVRSGQELMCNFEQAGVTPTAPVGATGGLVFQVASSFRTGNAAGYELEQVQLNLSAPVGTPGALRVALHAQARGCGLSPEGPDGYVADCIGERLEVLSGASPSAEGVHAFTGDAVLTRQTTYFVVLSAEGASTSGDNLYRASEVTGTDSNQNDEGWRIDETQYQKTGDGNFVAQGSSILPFAMAIVATITETPKPELTLRAVNTPATEGRMPELGFSITPSIAFSEPTSADPVFVNGEPVETPTFVRVRLVGANAFIPDVRARTQTVGFVASDGTRPLRVAFPIEDDRIKEADAMVVATILPSEHYTVRGPASAMILDDDEANCPAIGGTLETVCNYEVVSLSQTVSVTVGTDPAGTNQRPANAFTTGDSVTGYRLTTVSAQFLDAVGTPGDIRVVIRAEQEGAPGAELGTLTGANPSTAGEYAFTASGIQLFPRTTYFVVFAAPDASDANHHYRMRAATDGTQTGSPNWSLGDTLQSSPRGGAFAATPSNVPLVLAVVASRGPLPVLTLAAANSPVTESRLATLAFRVTSNIGFAVEREITVTLSGAENYFDESDRTQSVVIPRGSTEAVTAEFLIANDAVDNGGASVLATIEPNPEFFLVAGTARAEIVDDDALVNCPVPSGAQETVCGYELDETADTLVIGTPDAESAEDINLVRANAFTTGSSFTGYVLNSVGAWFAETQGEPGALSVAIHADNGSGEPAATPLPGGTLLGESPSVSGGYTFTTGRELRLERNTTYFIVFATTTTADAQGYHLRVATDEEVGSRGWSIGDDCLLESGATWGTFGCGQQLALSVVATPAPRVALTLAAVSASVTEATGAMLGFTITPSTVFTAAQTVRVRVSGADAYFAEADRTQSATIPAGSTAAVTVNFPLVNDNMDNGSALATATIVPNASVFTVVGPATASVVDDDVPQLSIAAAGATVTEGTDATLDFAITPDSAFRPPHAVTVRLTGGDAFVAAADREQVVTFLAGVTTARTVSFPIVDDTMPEPDATVTATIVPDTAFSIAGPATAMILNDDTVPDAPSGVTAEPLPESLLIGWTAPFDGGAPITSYEICVLEDSAFDAANCTGAALVQGVAADARSETLSDLTALVAHTVAVRAVNVAGVSPFSVPVTATPAASIPDAPTGVTAEPLPESLLVGWAAPFDDGGAPITSYEICVLQSSAFDAANCTGAALVAGVSASARSETVGDLVARVAHTVAVRAVNAAGASPFSEPVTATPASSLLAPEVVLEVSSNLVGVLDLGNARRATSLLAQRFTVGGGQGAQSNPLQGLRALGERSEERRAAFGRAIADAETLGELSDLSGLAATGADWGDDGLSHTSAAPGSLESRYRDSGFRRFSTDGWSTRRFIERLPALNFNLGESTGVWASASYADLTGTPRGAQRIGYEADTQSVQFGLDRRFADGALLLGLSIGWNTSDSDVTHEQLTEGAYGEIERDSTMFYPYLSWRAGEASNLWLIGGYGTGDYTMRVQGREDEADTTQWMFSGGGERQIDTEAFAIKLRGAGLWSNSDVDAGSDYIPAFDTATWQAQGEVEFARKRVSRVRPYLLSAVRVQGGDDIESGTALDVGVGLQASFAEAGLSFDFGLRGQASGLEQREEHLVYGSLRYDEGADRLGFTAALSQGMSQVLRSDWRVGEFRDASSTRRLGAQPGLQARFGYGWDARLGERAGVLTAFTELRPLATGFSPSVGLLFQGDRFQFSLEGSSLEETPRTELRLRTSF